MMLPAHIAQTTPDGFYGEAMAQACVALYVMSFLVAALNVMRVTMWYTVRPICIAQTPAYLVASRLPMNQTRCRRRLGSTFWFGTSDDQGLPRALRPWNEYRGAQFASHVLYSIGLYLTQSWEIGLLCYGVVFAYPSLRIAIETLSAARGKMVKSPPAWPPKDIEARRRPHRRRPSAAPSPPPSERQHHRRPQRLHVHAHAARVLRTLRSVASRIIEKPPACKT